MRTCAAFPSTPQSRRRSYRLAWSDPGLDGPTRFRSTCAMSLGESGGALAPNNTAGQQKRAVNLAILVAALGYFVDIYDLILFSIVRVKSLRGIGVPEA